MSPLMLFVLRLGGLALVFFVLGIVAWIAIPTDKAIGSLLWIASAGCALLALLLGAALREGVST